MEPSTTFCCVQCRLLQPATVACAECGSSMVAPVELVRELLHYRDMKVATGRDWAFITAMIAGTSVAYPVLAPIALGSIVVLGVSRLHERIQRHRIVGVHVPAPVPQPAARTLVGTVRRFRSTVSSIVGVEQALLEHVGVVDRLGATLIRRSTGAAFLLERGREEPPVLVTGEMRLVTRIAGAGSPPAPTQGLRIQRDRVRRDDPRLRRMGVPGDLAIAGMLEASTLVEGTGAVAVTGLVEDEAVAELAFHRDGGSVPVMRGSAGAPVLVEDSRLRTVALAVPLGGHR